jgi:hypothetical protein
LDAYGAVWLFTVKNHYYTGRLAQTELPMGAVEMHLSYDVKPRLWFSADANFWYGGATSLNGLTTRKSPLRGSTPGFANPNSRGLVRLRICSCWVTR